MADVEEANKIRAALGMPLLPVFKGNSDLNFKPSVSADDSDEEQASTLELREAAGYENWKKLQDEEANKQRREAQRLALKKQRDASQKNARLEGKGLGEGGDEDLDTRAWLLGAKKRERKLAKQRAKRIADELAERENQIQYTESDLAGAKVGHELRQFDDLGEQILTLKDANIEDEEAEDELENMDLREAEKLEDRLRLKKRKAIYDPNAEDESRSILGQYDEEIEGKKRHRFTLDGNGRVVGVEGTVEQQSGHQSSGISISLDFLRDERPTSDYQDVIEIKVRKPKKKKDKSKKRHRDEEDLVLNNEPERGDLVSMDVDTRAQSLQQENTFMHKTGYLDDEDLQAQIAQQRRLALKQRKFDRPEDVARRLREEIPATPDTIQSEHSINDGGLIIDETTEFISNLQNPSMPDTSNRRASSQRFKEEEEPAPSSTKVNISDESNNADDDISDVREDAAVYDQSINEEEKPANGLDTEDTLESGLGSTLSMLVKRGLLKTAASGDVHAIHKERQRFLGEKQKREAEAERKARLQRERDRASGKFDRMSAREREQYAQWENKQRDQQDSRSMAEIFNRDYKPNVELKYVDDFGRHMNRKEAFKHMSHQFHGKGSGKQKTEKKLKKIADERRREAQSTLDSSESTGMNNAAGQTARKNRQAGIRLQ